MRFLKGMRDYVSPDNGAVTARLSAVTNRGKIEVSSYHCGESAPVERRLWSQDEVGAEAAACKPAPL